MQPEADVAKTHAAPGTTVLTGIYTVDALKQAVPADCRFIMSFGLAGGLSPNLPIVGQTVIASRLIGPDKTVYNPDLNWVRRLFSQTHAYTMPWYSSGEFNQANTPSERAVLHDEFSANVIDDESLAVAQFAQQAGIAFAIMRTISDAWDDNVSITSNLLNASGGVSIPAVLNALVSDPSDMIKIWRDYNLSIAELGVAAIEVGPSFQAG